LVNYCQYGSNNEHMLSGRMLVLINRVIYYTIILGISIRIWGAERVENPQFNIERGFYTTAIQIRLSTVTEGADIRYTLDSTTPSAQVGLSFASPITITRTTVVRAIAFRDGMDDSWVITHTYLFPEDVVEQPALPPGVPGMWGDVPANYDMNPLYPESNETIIAALKSLPTLSIVTDPEDMFGAEGIYLNGGRDDNAQYEKAGSIEFIYQDGVRNFQENTGVQPRNQPIQKTRKRGFRFDFKTGYGAGHLEKPIFDDAIESPETAVKRFDSIILRSGYMENYTGREFNPAYMIYIRDPMVRNAQLAVSGYGTHNLFVQTYVNGLYWGTLNLTETIDVDYLIDYFGGEESQWTIIKSNAKSNDNGQIVAGNPSLYLELLDLVETADLSQPENYARVTSLIDPVYFADYIILQNYYAVGDWPNNNWIFTMRSYPLAQPGRFFCWDAEKCWLENDDPQSYKHAWYSPYLWSNSSEELVLQGYTTVPSRIWRALIKNREFRMLFADRVYLHMFNDGPLSESNNLARFNHITDYVFSALPADQKRWSDDDTRDIDPGKTYTPVDWQTEVNKVLNNIDSNGEHFLSSFRDHQLYPDLNPPVFNTSSGDVSSGFQFEMSNPNSQAGTIYYTLNGSDPREVGGAIAGEALDGGDEERIGINGTVTINARINEGEAWSALNRVTLINEQNLGPIKITEIMYRSSDYLGMDGDEFEFVEIKNAGTERLNLSRVSFSEGIEYTFREGVLLEGQQFLILAKNREFFQMKYGIQPYDQYGGNLDNKGERITLSDPGNQIIFSVNYDNNEPWPPAADGAGYSLVPVDYNMNPNPDDSGNWRASLYIHGSPGKNDSSRFVLPIPPVFAPNTKMLFIVKSDDFDEFPDDQIVFTHLDAYGAEVTVMEEDDVNEAAAIGKSLILISRSVTAGVIKSEFRNVEVPVILWESSLYDNMGMTGETEGLDYGEINEIRMQVMNSDHPAAGGLTGLVRINYNKNNDMTWGKPNDNAVVIANWQDEDSKAAIYLYEKNTEMFGLTAPARRIGFFMNEGIAAEQTVAGWQLFDGAVRWALYAPEDTTRPPEVEDAYMLYQNYPNPFNGDTRITYRLPQPANVKLEIYTITGRKVRTLVDQEQSAGSYSEYWDGTLEAGTKVASGMYIFRLKTIHGVQAKKMLYIK
jgi:hypothetical protein